MYNKKNWHRFIFIFLLGAIAFSFLACDNTVTEEAEYFTVIYDGNGGYLGNKTNTIRKLRVAPDSKIPKYLSDYSQDPYVVSSLGLATRDGYSLQGWYLAENAEYAPNPDGAYVYLDLEAGNGLYRIDDQGAFVYGHVATEGGPYVFLFVQEIPDDGDPETNEQDTTEFIYFDGDNGYGFYIYDAENPDHVAIYEADGSYLPAEISSFGSNYNLFADLSPAFQALFADAPRYDMAYYPYTEADEGLTRYSFESGYIYLSSMLVLDPEGDYVVVDGNYVAYDSGNPEHAALDRYAVDRRYVFTPSVDVPTPSDLPRFNASITYWDFENDRVTADITLIADWVQKPTVNFIQKSGQIVTVTTKLSEDNTTSVPLVVGETIGKLETIPLYAGYTFVGWSLSADEWLPWDFDNDVYPSGASELNLYAFMIEGEYTRITSVTGLSKVGENLAGNYLLVVDIDLGGAVYSNASPLGIILKNTIGSVNTPFTGKFISFGNTISNFVLEVKNSQKEINEDAGMVAVAGLFPFVQDATISGIRLTDVTVRIVTDPNLRSVVCDLGGAALIGTALAGTTGTVVDDVQVSVTFVPASATVLTKTVYVGDIVARGAESVTITDSTALIDYTAITGITTGTLQVQVLE